MQFKLGAFIFVGMLLFSLTVVLAESNHGEIFEQAEELVNSQITCDELTEMQLEMIGEYYMELMHPGELHEIMDVRFGGEGSESLRLAHVNIGKMQYCGEYNGMMGGSGISRNSSMSGSLDNDFNSDFMMDGSPSKSYGMFGWIVGLLVTTVLILLIVLLYKKVRGKK
jgi:hypothetical protein